MAAAASPSLGRATVVSAAVDAALAAVSLGSAPLLVHALGKEPYGVLGLVTVLGTQLATLQLGVGPSLLRLVGEARGRGDVPLLHATLRSGLILSLLSALAVGGLALVLAPRAWSDAFTTSAAVRSQAMAAVPATALVLSLQPLLALAFITLTGLERFTLLNGTRLVHGALRAAAGVAVAWQGGSLAGVLLAQSCVDAVTAVAVAAASYRLPPAGAHVPLRATAVRLLALGVPLSLAGFPVGLLLDGDKLALGALRSVAEVAYYTLPFGVVARLASLTAMVSVFLVPRLAACTAVGENAEAARLAARATRIAMGVTAAVAAPLAALAPELLRLWLGPAFEHGSTPAARVLLVAVVANVSVFGAHAVIRARSPGHVVLLLALVELPFFAALLWILVRPWGPVGAALAWGLRAAADSVLQHLIARWTLGVRIVPFAPPALAVTGMAAFTLACHAAGPSWWPVRALAGAAVSASALLLLPAGDRDSLLRALHLAPATRAPA